MIYKQFSKPYRWTIILRLCLFCAGFVTSPSISADVVKPALIEISAHKTGRVELEIRASIEALLTGINATYKNTKDAPNADIYDELRALRADELEQKFGQFDAEFLEAIQLRAHTPEGSVLIPLAILKIDIPEPGYTQVPRISTLWLKGELPENATAISLTYPTRFSDYAVRVRQVDLEAEKWHWSSWEWIKTERESRSFSLSEIYAEKTAIEIIIEFTQLGFLHILPRGLDHILFILGLFLFSRSLRPLLWQVTMFTLAHTVTLGLATAGYIELSPRIVEPLIALSIAYVGFENVFSTQLHRHRLILVFAFGLLHGMGFASVLAEFELPKDAFFTSLLSFNVGVELGQLAVITLAWSLLGWFTKSPVYRRIVTIPGSLIIGVTGTIWTIERLNLI
jgi:hydrogenase/urease accessory protein HupE